MNCWWCLHPFPESTLVRYPYDFKNNVFVTTGQFCSWGCVKAYASDRNNYRSMDYITLMKKRIFGKIVSTKMAPSRQSLKMFGGTLSIEEFRDLTANTQVTVKVNVPGELYFPVELVVSTVAPSFKEKKGTGSETFALKREKPMDRNVKGTLASTLGVTKKK